MIPDVVNARWRVYLQTGAVRVDLNNDGDFVDVGDIAIGTGTSSDTTPPSMSQPSNITVTAAIGRAGAVRVYYDSPVTSDGSVDPPVQCSPASGSLFSVGIRTVTCLATDGGGNTRTRTFTVTVVADAFQPVPVVSSGGTALIEAEGFQPNSLVTITLRSTPTVIGVFETDDQGRFVISINLPGDLANGAHDIIVSGLAPDGTAMQFVQPLIVDPDQLPKTGGGASTILPSALLLTFVGLLLMLTARPTRRRDWRRNR